MIPWERWNRVATYRALAAVCEAVIRRLEASYDTAVAGQHLTFDLYNGTKFRDAMPEGISLFPYRVYLNGTHRSPGRGRRLPLELHFLLTVWAQDPATESTLAGWLMAQMEAEPVLTHHLLNRNGKVFQPSESVEIVAAELSTQDLFTIWERLGAPAYHLSIPYMARVMEVEF